MEVFPAFDLPMMSTLNRIFGTRGPGGARDRAGDDDGAGDSGDVAGVEAADRAGDGAGAGAGGDAGADAGYRAGDDAGAGDSGDVAGVEAADRAGDGAEAEVGGDAGAAAGDRAGDDAGGGDVTKQQVLCFTPMTRKYCEKKDWAKCVDHLSESGSCYNTQYRDRRQLTDVPEGHAPHAVSFHLSILINLPHAKSGAIRTHAA